ncbi:MAG: serine/threonine protein kinase [Proteobacteria bacterium]|nr:serine/threonine protein kinase [Pseudomonadota bacterium]MCP4918156.1 serine/threonine protein kinase [Pseudomonadota bacterium]
MTSPTSESLAAGTASEEAARARNIGVVFTIIGLVTAIWAPLLDGEPALKPVVAGVMLLFTAASAWTAGQASSDRYSLAGFRIYGAIAVLASTMCLIYLGPFSPTAQAVTLGIAFFGQGSDRVGAWAICVSSIVLYVALFAVVIAGVVPDVGVFRGDEAGLGGRLFMMVVAPLVLVVTLSQARTARVALSGAIEKVVDAGLEERRRDVQLQEAQAELDRFAAQEAGRMTSHTVGPYRLGRLLGRGGVGEVYEALDSRTTQVLAVKVLNEEFSLDENIRERFVREGEILAALDSPHVVKVFEHGVHQGVPYIAMEKLVGRDLAVTLRQYSRLSAEQANVLAHHCAAGLRAAHAAGVIHRDIKPRNIFLTADGNWKILDFGVSKLAGATTVLTVGQVIGTPHYMAPEQANGGKVDHRTDIYALGAVLYRVLTGRTPVEGRGHRALLAAAVRRPLRPRAIAPDISPEVEAVLACAMAGDIALRFESIDDMDRAMTQAVSGKLGPRWWRRAAVVKWRKPAGA